MSWILIICLILGLQNGDGWRAVPANQAHYALRNDYDYDDPTQYLDVADELLPRDQLNNIYKFGWCTRDVLSPKHFVKSVNISFTNWKSTQVGYIYLLARQKTIRYRYQCIIMKMYTPRKYLFYKSRLPLYYCQGTVHFLMMNTINRYEIHEFYLVKHLLAPANFVFEFYHYKPF